MEGFSLVTPITGLNRPNTGKEDDDEVSAFRTNLAREQMQNLKLTLEVKLHLHSFIFSKNVISLSLYS
jgi:hypothetical protein